MNNKPQLSEKLTNKYKGKILILSIVDILN